MEERVRTARKHPQASSVRLQDVGEVSVLFGVSIELREAVAVWGDVEV